MVWLEMQVGLLMESRAGRQVIFHILFSSTLVKLLFQLFFPSAYCESVILDWKVLMLGLNLKFIIQLFVFMLLQGCPDVLVNLHKCCVFSLPRKKNYICVNFLWVCKGSAELLSLVSLTLYFQCRYLTSSIIRYRKMNCV